MLIIACEGKQFLLTEVHDSLRVVALLLAQNPFRGASRHLTFCDVSHGIFAGFAKPSRIANAIQSSYRWLCSNVLQWRCRRLCNAHCIIFDLYHISSSRNFSPLCHLFRTM